MGNQGVGGEKERARSAVGEPSDELRYEAGIRYGMNAASIVGLRCVKVPFAFVELERQPSAHGGASAQLDFPCLVGTRCLRLPAKPKASLGTEVTW